MAQERSPNYPSFSLEEGIRTTEKIFNEAGRTAIDREQIAKLAGYASLNGSAVKLISALAAYGLIEKQTTGRYSVSTEALRIIKNHGEGRQKDLEAAMWSPAIFQRIHEKYHECSENVLANQLLIEEGFTQDGAAKAAAVYFANKNFVRPSDTASEPTTKAEADATNGARTNPGGSDSERDNFPPKVPPVPPTAPTPLASGRAETMRENADTVIAEFSVPLAGNQLKLCLSGSEEMLVEDIDDIDIQIDYLKRQLRRKLQRQANVEAPSTAATQSGVPTYIAFPSPLPGIWKNKDFDKPTTFIGIMKQYGFEDHYQTEDGTGVPVSQVEFIR